MATHTTGARVSTVHLLDPREYRVSSETFPGFLPSKSSNHSDYYKSESIGSNRLSIDCCIKVSLVINCTSQAFSLVLEYLGCGYFSKRGRGENICVRAGEDGNVHDSFLKLPSLQYLARHSEKFCNECRHPFLLFVQQPCISICALRHFVLVHAMT